MDAQDTTAHLGGKWHGGYGTAPCPCCQYESRRDQDALTITDGHDRLLLNCKKGNCSFTDILAAAGISAGEFVAPDPAIAAQRTADMDRAARKRAAQAQSVWKQAIPMLGTVSETYLRNRGITCDLPHSLRFCSDCWHLSAKCFPAMLGAVTRLNGSAPASIHRTYLSADGSGKADVEPSKAMLGATAGGCVRLSWARMGPLVIAEGIETALSLMSGILTDPSMNVVAALSTSGVRGLALPPEPGELIVAADGDAAGREAANNLAGRASLSGWHVSLMVAPEGMDWNDVLVQRGAI